MICAPISRGPRRAYAHDPADAQSFLCVALIFPIRTRSPVAIEDVQRRAGSCRKCPVKMKRAEAGVACQFSQNRLLGMMSPRPVIPSIENLMNESSQTIGTASATSGMSDNRRNGTSFGTKRSRSGNAYTFVFQKLAAFCRRRGGTVPRNQPDERGPL